MTSSKLTQVDESVNEDEKVVDKLESTAQEEPSVVDEIAVASDGCLSSEDSKLLASDRLRYEKNKLSSSLALITILFNALYFISVYRAVEGDFGAYFYTYQIGLSVLYNLVFMLVTFLSSEGVKNYKLSFSIVLIAVGILQILRIFYLPLQANATMVTTSLRPELHAVIENAQFTRICIYLCASGAAAIAGGVVGIIKNLKLKKCLAALGEVM